MKRLFLLLTLTVAAVTAMADVTFESGNFAYSLKTSDNWVTCTGLSAQGVSNNPNSITIPYTVSYNGSNYHVKKVGANAFKGNTQLESVTLACDSIETSAFMGCSNLTTITFKDGVKRIGRLSFQGTAISSVLLPATLNSIETNSFDDCSNFVSYNVASGNNYYSVSNGLLFNKVKTKLIRVPVGKDPGTWFEKDIPLSLTILGDWSCSNSKVSPSRVVDIPPTVQTVYSYAFAYSTMYSVTIPSSVTNISNYAFVNSSLVSAWIGADTPPSINATVFQGCNLDRLYVPVNTWKRYANDTNWKQFKTIKTGGYDFYNYYASTKGDFIVTKAATATTRGEVKMVYGTRDADWTVYIPTTAYCAANGPTYNVVAIADSCFAGNSRLTSAVMPSGATTVPRRAFENCTKLQSVDMKNATSIGDSAFYNCSALTDVTFAGYTTKIGDYAFMNSGITGSANLHSATYACALGKQAFYNCPNLSEIIVYGSTMGNDAFGGSMSSAFKCYVYYPYTATRRNGARSWTNGSSTAPSRILPYFASTNTSMLLSMPDKVTNPVHCILPTAAASGDTKYYAVTKYNLMFGGEFRTQQLGYSTALKAGDAILVKDITPGKIYRMGVPTSTPAALTNSLLVGNPYASGTSVTREDDSYYYYYRPANGDFYRYYSDFTVGFGSGYLRDTGKNTQNTIVNIDAFCYPLVVASTRVKPENAANITSNYIKSGTAVYDPDENTLTLDNITIETGASTGGMISNIPDLTIILKGNNTMTMTGENNNYTGLTLEECSGVTMTGGGSLTLGGGNNGNTLFLTTHQPADSVMFTIKDCTVNASPFSDDYKENLTVDNATLRGKQLSIGHTLVLKDCYVAKPVGATFEYGMFWIEGQGYYYGDFEILPGSGGLKGDVNDDDSVNAGDVSAVYNVMLGITTDEAIIARADVNGDNSVNAGDVSAVYEIMLKE